MRNITHFFQDLRMKGAILTCFSLFISISTKLIPQGTEEVVSLGELLVSNRFKEFNLIVAGGRSRLHLIDLGSGEKSTKPGRTSLTLPALGHVILTLLQGQKHLPYK